MTNKMALWCLVYIMARQSDGFTGMPRFCSWFYNTHLAGAMYMSRQRHSAAGGGGQPELQLVNR